MIRKILKILIKISIVLITLFLVTLLVAQKLFPPEKIRKILVSEMETALGRKVIAGNLYLKPFKGILLNDVHIYEKNFQKIASADSSYFFSVKAIQLNYNLLALLTRKIQINKILIDSPEINLVQDQYLQWNFQDIIAPDTSAPIDSSAKLVADDSLAETAALPITVDLKTLTLKNIVINFIMDQADARLTVKSGGITCQIDNLFLPRQTLEEALQKANADFAILSNNTPWQIIYYTKADSISTEINSRLKLTLATKVNGAKNISGNADIALADVRLITWDPNKSSPEIKQFPLPQLFSFAFEMNANAKNETIELKKFIARIGEETLFNITGTVSQFLQQPYVDLVFSESQIRFHEIFAAFVPLLPDSIKTELENFKLSGIATFNGTKFIGNPLSASQDETLTCDLKFNIYHLNFEYIEPLTRLSNVNLKIDGNTLLNAEGFQHSDVSAELNIDSFMVVVDTSKYLFKNISSEFRAKLGNEFSPQEVIAKFSIEDFFDVPLNLTADFKSIDGLINYITNLNLTVSALPLARLTNDKIEGAIDFNFSLASQKLDKIDGTLTVVTDIIEVAAEQEPIIISPMELTSNFLMSVDTSFEQIKLQQLKMEINDFAQSLMHGNFILAPSVEIFLSIDEFIVDHRRAMEIIPQQFLVGMESLKIDGTSNLTSTLSVKIPENQDPLIDANAKLSIVASLDYPELFLTIGSIISTVDVLSDGVSVSAKTTTTIDSLIMVDVQDKPLNNISVSLKAFLPDFETVKLESALVVIPALKTEISGSAQIDSLSGLLTANAATYLNTNTGGDTITVLNDIRLIGNIKQKSAVKLAGNFVQLFGNVEIDNLNIFYADIANVESITGRINFVEKIDIENGVLVESTSRQTLLADAGDFYYDLLRSYYQQDQDMFSTIHINKIQALDYQVENVNLDLMIQNTEINISRFAVNLYDGNMSGVVAANLHSGNPEDIEWKIKANLSRMNSAKLLTVRKEKTRGSDLNMNMELKGKGVDIQNEINLDGYLYVTKIGPKFTDNLLRSLDPTGADKSIQDTRRLLNWGYKPKLISFEVKHDNLYPAIHLVKGNLLTKLIPLNLSGGKIELARIPIKMLLSNFQIEPQ